MNLFIPITLTVFFSFSLVKTHAKPLDIFFGTSGRGSEGIYHATFNPENGKFSPSKLAAKIDLLVFWLLIPMERFYILLVVGKKAQVHWDIVSVVKANSRNLPA